MGGILVIGFKPWGRFRRNPSGEVAHAVGGPVLPVSYDGATRRLKSLVRSVRPSALLLLGLAPGRRRITLEMLALNMDHSEEPPRRRSRPIDPSGPLVRRTRLPVDILFRKLRRAGLSVGVSFHAGTFVCNHVFYEALRLTKVPCGFVHLPPPSRVPLRDQIRAVELIAEELA